MWKGIKSNLLWGTNFLFVFSFIIVFSLILPTKVSARSGCCSWHSGVCGCQCCDGTPLSATCAPYYPGCGGGYVPIPTCPLFSRYDSFSDSCKCYSGYIKSGSRCISQDEYCQNIYGFSSKYNISKDNCECKYGYVFDNSKCISGNQYCWNKYGFNSSYNSLSKTCECRYGYVFNRMGTKCISEDEACREQFGFGAKAAISSDKCECKYGYAWEGNNCVLDDFNDDEVFDSGGSYEVKLPPSPTPPLKQEPVVSGATTERLLTPSPTPAQPSTPTPKPEPTPSPEESKEPENGDTGVAWILGGIISFFGWIFYRYRSVLVKKLRRM